jgi:hypothetical protein
MNVRLYLAVFATAVLSGCGTGGQFTPPPVAPPPAAHVTITISPSAVQPGQTATLTWSAINAKACAASGDWSGTQQTSGSQNILLPGTQSLSFTLACTGAGAKDSQTAKLAVAPPPGACPAKPAIQRRADRRISRHRKPSPSNSVM